jgi:hypothetical protein
MRQMLSLKKREQAESVPRTKAMIGRQIAAVDAQIDKAVYGLYNLTESEMAVIEGGKQCIKYKQEANYGREPVDDIG